MSYVINISKQCLFLVAKSAVYPLKIRLHGYTVISELAIVKYRTS